MVELNNNVKRVNDVMCEWYEFKVMDQMLPSIDLLVKVVSTGDTFPLLSKLLSVVATLRIIIASCHRSICVMNMVKTSLGHICRQVA
jgi:hypothetical protein